MSEFADGSRQIEAVDVLAPQLHQTELSRMALEAKSDVLSQEAGRRLAALTRRVESLRSKAHQMVVAGRQDQVIRYARSIHQQHVPGGSLPEPRLDLTGLEPAAGQARELDQQQLTLIKAG